MKTPRSRPPAAPRFAMDKIKVVIWDLDETFWGGTLSEEGVEFRPAHAEIVRELARRGIVSSICSKNDPEPVRALLEEHDLWGSFVFPRIGWKPKGGQIRELLEQMRLRAPNALFLDDNPMNLEEASFYCPGLQTAGPEAIATLLDDPRLQGKSDPELSRLGQYRILEEKTRDQAAQSVSNEEFLRQSGIRVERRRDVDAVLDRLAELVERTNQLNYTKRRDSAEELAALLAEPGVEAGYLHVSDRYGDYGIAGFHAAREGRLLHFVFSCRILDMGVERWLYRELGEPELEAVGEVATPLRDERGEVPVIDWITEGERERVEVAETGGPRVLLKGGCDLDQVADYLGPRMQVTREFNYVTSDGISIHREHTELLRGAATLDVVPPEVLDFPFVDAGAFQTDVFAGTHDICIYSVLMDYTQGVYRHRDSDVRVAYGDHQLDITDREQWSRLHSRAGLSPEDLERAVASLEFQGAISEERFAENLRWIRATLPAETWLILMNGAEVDLDHPVEGKRGEHHRRMNRVLDEVASELPRTVICDVRPLVQGPDDVTDNVRHYRRRVYYQLATELRLQIEEITGVETGGLGHAVHVAKTFALKAFRRTARSLFR